MSFGYQHDDSLLLMSLWNSARGAVLMLHEFITFWAVLLMCQDCLSKKHYFEIILFLAKSKNHCMIMQKEFL